MANNLEICCTSFQSALNAQEAKADRIELCDNIYEGGTTPSPGLIEKIHCQLSIPVHVLIRPRGGDFVYTDDEFEVMINDISYCRKLGVKGIVAGVLNSDGTVDYLRTKKLKDEAASLDFTFHRAFDLVIDQRKALNELISLGATRILTSGGENSVSEGKSSIANMIKHSGDAIQIMAGGGLRPGDIPFLKDSGCQHFHTTAKAIMKSTPVSTAVKMNSYGLIENSTLVASQEKIAEYRSLLDLE